LLHDLDFSLQSTRKTEEGEDHPDRDAQFRYLNRTVKRYLTQQLPVISADTKRKELIGNYANTGQQWRPTRQPHHVQGHDFPTPDVPRASPFGMYDIGRNHGFVNVGTDHDTGEFAVASIRGWWRHEGRRLYPRARRILITAYAGGSNGWRLRLWKLELQTFADQTGLHVEVCHFPPGTRTRRCNTSMSSGSASTGNGITSSPHIDAGYKSIVNWYLSIYSALHRASAFDARAESPAPREPRFEPFVFSERHGSHSSRPATCTGAPWQRARADTSAAPAVAASSTSRLRLRWRQRCRRCRARLHARAVDWGQAGRSDSRRQS
jgi:hypothetical protein